MFQVASTTSTMSTMPSMSTVATVSTISESAVDKKIDIVKSGRYAKLAHHLSNIK